MEITHLPYLIFNLHCMIDRDDPMLLAVDSDNKLVLREFSSAGKEAHWIFYPNLLKGAETAGYTLYNKSTGDTLAVKLPSTKGDQITMADFVEGDESFFWNIWPSAVSSSGEQLWAIQGSNHGYAMDAYNMECSRGTKVIVYPWKPVINSNQKWIIIPNVFGEKMGPGSREQIAEYLERIKDKIRTEGK